MDPRDMETHIQYGLKLAKNNSRLGWRYEEIRGDDECGEAYYFIEHSDRIWLVDSQEEAERVRAHTQEWYNSTLDYPAHRYKPEELVVYKLTSIFEDV